MAIGDNLRQLRISLGLTQAQVAEQIGVTRQALASYEAGRTQPGIEMLLRLAEVYGTDLDSVLHDWQRGRKRLWYLKVITVFVLGAMLLLTLTCSVLRWSGSLFLPIPEGILEEGLRATWERRQSLNTIITAAESTGLLLSRIGPALLLLLLLVWKCPVSQSGKLILLGLWLAGMGLVTLPFACTDPFLGIWNYLAIPVNMSLSTLLIWVVALAVDAVLLKFRYRAEYTAE